MRPIKTYLGKPFKAELLMFALLGFLPQNHAQILANGNFETNTATPLTISLDNVPGSDNRLFTCGTGWSNATLGTADYFSALNNTICTGSSNTVEAVSAVLPNYFGTEAVTSPNNCYAGVLIDIQGGNITEEYITTTLNQPLTAGNRYQVNFNVSLAEGSHFGVDRIGAYFCFSNAVPVAIQSPLNVTPQGFDPTVIMQTDNWHNVQFTFTAAQAFDQIVIGHFYQINGANQSTPRTPATVCCNRSNWAYYYIDDVEVTDFCDCEEPVLTTTYTPHYNLAADTCAFDLSIASLSGGCGIDSVRIYNNETGQYIRTIVFSPPIAAGSGIHSNVGTIKLADFFAPRTIRTEIFGAGGRVLCQHLDELPGCDKCRCEEPNLSINFRPVEGPDGSCGYELDITSHTKDACTLSKVTVFDDDGNIVDHESFNGGIIEGGSGTHTGAITGISIPSFAGIKNVGVIFYDANGELCTIPGTLQGCCCINHELVAVPVSTNPCCKDVYAYNASCDVYKIKTDAPNNITPITSSTPIIFPRFIGTFCNGSSGNKTVTVRYLDTDNDTLCSKSIVVACPTPTSCCNDLYAYLAGVSDPNGNCACKYNVIVTQYTNSPCHIYSYKVYDIGAGDFTPAATVTLGPINFGLATSVGELCVPTPTDPVHPAWVTVRLLIVFYDQAGNKLCEQYLTQDCYYPLGRPGNANGNQIVQGLNEQLNSVLKFACQPNPFAGETEFSYSLSKASKVRLELIDSRGNLVEVIESQDKAAGDYKVKYNNLRLPKGLYIARLSAGHDSGSIKVLIEN